MTVELRQPETESNLSVNSVDRLCGGSISDSASRDANCSVNLKRTSVVFEEPKSGNFVGGSSTLLSHNRQVATSKTVNGILRKGSLRGAEEEKDPSPGLPSLSRKSRKGGDHRHHKDRSHSGSSKASKYRGSKNEESGEDHDGRSSRSRSNSTKSTKSEKKEQNNLALTRDLPWCGCWGNGCL